MGIELEQRSLTAAQFIGQGFAEATVIKSVQLPPDLPNMSDTPDNAVLWVGGVPSVTSTVIEEGMVRVTGFLAVELIYAAMGEPDTAGSASLQDVKFEGVVPVPGARPGMEAFAEAHLVQLVAESTGVRAVSLTSAIAVSATVIQQVQVEYVAAAKATGESRISFQTDKVRFAWEAMRSKEQVRCDESLEIPDLDPACDPTNSLAAGSAVAKIRSVVIADGAVNVEGDIAVEAAYSMAGESPWVNVVQFECIPLSYKLEDPSIKKGMEASIQARIIETQVEPETPRTIRVRCLVELSSLVLGYKDIAVLSELGSETQEIVDQDKDIIIMPDLVLQETKDVTIEGAVAIHSALGARSPGDIGELKSAKGMASIVEVECLDEEISVRGAVSVRVICEDLRTEGSEFKGALGLNIPLEFTESIRVPDAEESDRVKVSATVEAVHVERETSAKLWVEASVKLDVSVYRVREVHAVVGAELIQPVVLDPYALTFYVVGPKDTVNRIAMRYGVPVDRIASSNGLGPNERPAVGRKLYIPAS